MDAAALWAVWSGPANGYLSPSAGPGSWAPHRGPSCRLQRGERIGIPSSWAQIPCPGSACSDPPPNQEVLVSQSWPGEAPTSRRALLCPFSPPTPLSLGPWALC